MTLNHHHYYMSKAYQQAELAYSQGEIPIGAVIVHQNRIIGKGYNQTERLQDPTAHAEMIAISAACNTLQNKYLNNCTMYITLEPCAMCSGAMVWSKLTSLVFGALDEKSGGSGSVFNITSNKHLNHTVEVVHGIMENESQQLLRTFFQERRNKNGSVM